ncbi:Methyltransferase type 11 [Niveomyces insectorum RCEF 264]|uniref:Methyltransferase type 11 n=1 Tax=Niveomyces insectorum RCEF 264 TaxID=1081102 RepID=A0A167T4N0_9HYPO|nr:Methyltransferase type 11 [Niveomyces insectorum RCEF 264]
MPPAEQEKTFSTYNTAQGQRYADARPDYHPSVYKLVLDQHRTTGGKFDTILDVGCGPGNVARTLAPHFANVYGLDPAPGMLATARALGGTSASGAPIQYARGTADDLTKAGTDDEDGSFALANNSVDLITAANAAHWFDMRSFWKSAAAVLVPGGSVALWTTGALSIHPDTVAAAAIQDIVTNYYEKELGPYVNAGSLLVRNQYRDLVLPWTEPEAPIPEFDKAGFFRRDWQMGELFVGEKEIEVNLDLLERVLATSSAHTRWCEAHPEDVGTPRDPLKLLRAKIEEIQHVAGVEKGKETVKGVALGTVMIVKKKTE